MHKQTTHYVMFTAPGSFVAEQWSQDIDKPDPRAVQWPGNAYAFTLHKREDVIDGDKTYRGKPEQVGPTYYHPDSYVQSMEEVRSNPKATDILLSNMRCNGWDQVIWTRWNTWPQPFEPGKMEILK